MDLEEATEYIFSEERLATPITPDQVSTEVTTSVPTPREEEVATLVARGLTNRQVASELHVSKHTIATHVSRILKKLGLSSRSELTA